MLLLAIWLTSYAGCNRVEATKETAKDSAAGLSFSESSSDRIRIHVAAASDLRFVMADLLNEFHSIQSQVEIEPIFGASGVLATQVNQQAPFDVFLSANQQYAQQVVDRGEALAEELFPYAQGKLCLWVPHESLLKVDQENLDNLLGKECRSIAMANDRYAPYGRAARETMESFGVFTALQSKIVVAETASQAAQYVESGNTDAAFIPLSLATAANMKEKGKYWLIPQERYQPLTQFGVILNRTPYPTECRTFKGYLQSEKAKIIFRQYGFSIPGES